MPLAKTDVKPPIICFAIRFAIPARGSRRIFPEKSSIILLANPGIHVKIEPKGEVISLRAFPHISMTLQEIFEGIDWKE